MQYFTLTTLVQCSFCFAKVPSQEHQVSAFLWAAFSEHMSTRLLHKDKVVFLHSYIDTHTHTHTHTCMHACTNSMDQKFDPSDNMYLVFKYFTKSIS